MVPWRNPPIGFPTLSPPGGPLPPPSSRCWPPRTPRPVPSWPSFSTSWPSTSSPRPPPTADPLTPPTPTPTHALGGWPRPAGPCATNRNSSLSMVLRLSFFLGSCQPSRHSSPTLSYPCNLFRNRIPTVFHIEPRVNVRNLAGISGAYTTNPLCSLSDPVGLPIASSLKSLSDVSPSQARSDSGFKFPPNIPDRSSERHNGSVFGDFLVFPRSLAGPSVARSPPPYAPQDRCGRAPRHSSRPLAPPRGGHGPAPPPLPSQPP